MNLFRIVHETSRTKPLQAYKAPARYHLTQDEAGQTSYLSLDEATSMAEVSHHLGGTVRLRNMIVIEFEVDLDDVADLTDKREMKRHRATIEQLIGDDHSLTQDLARRLRRDKVQALIVPSARDRKGKNVVLFLENINKKAIRKIREEKLE